MIGSSWVDKDPEWKLFMKAMQEQMSQLMNSHKVVQKQIGRMKQSQNITATTNQITHRQVHRGRWHDDNDESIYESFQGCRKWDDNLRSVKMKIPTFHGKSDPETYLAWEKKVDFVFDYHNYSKKKKVKLVIIGFMGYVLVWWNQLVILISHYG